MLGLRHFSIVPVRFLCLALAVGITAASACGGSKSDTPELTVTARFRDGALGSAARGGIGQASAAILGGGSSELAQIEQVSYWIYDMALCTRATEAFDVFEEVVDGVTIRTVNRGLGFEEGDCVYLPIGKPNHDPIANMCATDDEAWVNFVDPAEVAEKLTATHGIPAGTYRYLVLDTHPRAGIKAAVDVRDADGAQATLYTKQCGPSTCGSDCDWLTEKPPELDEHAWSQPMCKGPIPAPTQGSELGEVHPTTGDVWAESPFDTYDFVSDLIGEHNRYWRRCEHDMLTGPAEPAYLTALRFHGVYELMRPIQIAAVDDLTPDAGADAPDAGADTPDAGPPPVLGEHLEMLVVYNLEGLVSGSVSPMEQVQVDAEQALKHTQYYDVTDGFHAIHVQPLALTPVPRTDSEAIKRYSYRARVRRDTARPACYANGADQPPTFSGEGFDTPANCHPCSGQSVPCREGNTMVPANDRPFRMADMQPSSEFDVRIDLFRAVDPITGEPRDPYDIRAAQVTAFYGPDAAVDEGIRFYPMQVISVDQGVGDTVDLLELRMGLLIDELPRSGRFPRIRGLPIALTEGESSTVIVQLQEERIVHAEPECDTCGYACEAAICGFTHAYYEVPVVLESTNIVAGAP